MNLTRETISASCSDAELFKLLGEELQHRIPMGRESPGFVGEIQKLPSGLRAMAATYELDVSLALDDLGWHFGNWHDVVLAEETLRGLETLAAVELAAVFREAFQIALKYWDELAAKDWSRWYPGSPLEKEMQPLNQQARKILEGKALGLFDYWVGYARKHPEYVAGTGS